MTTTAQLHSNRANAIQYTGPASADGLRRSSQNARRHGLSGEPNAEDISAMAEVIFDGALPELGTDHYAVGMALATAEVRRSHAAQHLRDVEEELANPDPDVDDVSRRVEAIMADVGADKKREGRRLLVGLKRTTSQARAERHRLALRYLSEAEAQASKARHRYAKYLISRNEPNFYHEASSFPARAGLFPAFPAARDEFEVLDEEKHEPEVVGDGPEEDWPGIVPAAKNPGEDGHGEGPHKRDHREHKNRQPRGPVDAADDRAEVHEVSAKDEEEREPEGDAEEEGQFQIRDKCLATLDPP
ncbi:hypothetical protein B9057_14960 (plasmid) [Aestuarium zhoushanense]|nr:hypothetical protein B9057_14960 [Aestuarium zhoushanense]